VARRDWGAFCMTENQLYIQCNELLRSINLQEVIDDAFLKIVKTDLQEIQSEPESNYKTARQVLYNSLSSLRDQFRPTEVFDRFTSKMAS
jgi:hypothetical protein